MGKIELTINGRRVEAEEGQTILEVVRKEKIDDIPTLCHSDELEPYGSCFLCVVEVSGRANLLPSCATRVTDGMEVQTRNEKIIASRKTALELLLSNHYADCVSPCMEACPAGVDAQGYIALSAMGDSCRAVDLIRKTNPLPAVCGRVCVRKCEMNCRRIDVDSAVGINAIKRFVTDTPGIYDRDPDRAEPTGKTVGIVGSGPAGLTAAWFLGLAGHTPVVYEAMPRSGGMLRYGIPEYRLPDSVLDAEVDYICRAGAEIMFGKRVGKDITLDRMRKKHDAVFIATGAWTAMPIGVKGETETEGVLRGTDFLREKADRRDPMSGTVVVVGGGNTAMDVARTSWRLGADKVIILYRRTRAEMPADRMEIEDALEEGIEIVELSAPIGIKSEKGRLKSLRCIRMKLGEPDDSGRRRPVPLEGSEYDLPCDTAITAIGQNTLVEGLTDIEGGGIKLSRWDTFVTDVKTMETNMEGIFAGGDNANDGPTVVIDAIRDGQRAARAIDAYLSGSSAPGEEFAVHKEFWAKPGMAELGEVKESPRHEVHLIDVEERKGNFTEVATGFEYEDNVHECERCLSCGCVRYFDCALRMYAGEYGVDMEKYKGYVRKHRMDDRHPYIVYDPNKCVLCGRCIRTCSQVLPVSALGLVGRGFRTEVRPAMNDPLVETNCVSCGNCVDACPTAALTVKYPFPGRAALDLEEVETHCGFCSIGCPIVVKKFNDERYFVSPPYVPGEYLCRFGRFGNELFIKKNRLSAAEIQYGGVRRTVAIEEAVRSVISSLRQTAERHGASSVAVFVSPELTCEELYLAARIARDGIGTNNIASLNALTGEPGPESETEIHLFATAERACIDDADLIICNNTSVERDHLVLGVDVIRAVRRGAGLIVVNSILDSIDQQLSAVAMDPMRGTASILWSGIAKILAREGVIDRKALRDTKGAKAYLEGIGLNAGSVSSATGIEEEKIAEAARVIGRSKNIVFIHSPDRMQDRAAGDLQVLANLITLLRKSGFSAELILPRKGANGGSLELMGASPGYLPGRIPVKGGPEGASSMRQMVRMLDEGMIRGVLIIGEDPMSARRTGSWLRNAEYVAAMDWAETETTRYADAVLPGSTYLETEGIRINFEGRPQRYARAVTPPSAFSGKETLRRMLEESGVKLSGGELTDVTAGIVDRWFDSRKKAKAKADGDAAVVPVEISGEVVPVTPPLTICDRYRMQIREVGTGHFRVR